MAIYMGNQFAVAFALMVQMEIAVGRKEVVKDPHLGAVRLRLASMCFALATAAVSAYFMSPDRVWIPMIPVFIGVRIAREVRKRRMAAAVA